MQPEITTNVAGIKLRNPTILSAGILGMTGKSLRAVWEAGAGAVVTKSLGTDPRRGYKNPTIIEVRCGFINAMGLPNPGAKEYLRELSDASEGGEITVIGSVYGSKPQEYIEAAKTLAQGNIKAVELNVSCPHAKGVGAEVGQDPILVEKVVQAVKRNVQIPVFAKLTPNVTSITELAKAAERGGADAIVAINTLRAMAIDIETRQPILANKVGGLSGPAIKPVAVRCIYDISQEVDIPVIGCGGICDWRDAVEFLLAGARAVQIGTAVAYRDLKVFKEISEGIATYLSERGYKGVEEIVGLSHKA